MIKGQWATFNGHEVKFLYNAHQFYNIILSFKYEKAQRLRDKICTLKVYRMTLKGHRADLDSENHL